ncbi:hypothetical protein [Streptomyces sp. ADI93-02]|uniref:hypothetical protein n=1 Tax=Streptomyces sp. ADI93-02 TaxID=1522757 RepID=UPI001F153CFE|nr:hypothetical protein [Streptomyces sp. ADI93-02]
MPKSIEITAENLEEELHRLQAQRESLQRELAAVVAHLSSIQTALKALQDLMRTSVAETAPAPAEVSERTDDQPGPVDQAVLAEARDRPTANPRDPEEKQEPKPTVPRAGASPAPAKGQAKYGKLTEQIEKYFAGTGGRVIRARDVAAALGRDTDAGSINAVRSTLDRLVGTSRIQRAGRGLYRANP